MDITISKCTVQAKAAIGYWIKDFGKMVGVTPMA
jgi:hypothetical protein